MTTWNLDSTSSTAALGLVAMYFWWALSIGVHVSFAILVGITPSRRKIAFGGRGLWVIAALVGGPLAAAAYWVVNVSSLGAADMHRPMPPLPSDPRP